MKHNRAPIIVVLIIALILAGITRSWANRLRGNDLSAASGSSLSGMNSFGLGLLLGGLRGPLVMFLWSTSESQKSTDNLDDFDTKVEWIRLLQPEFDSVHIFQIWNKAYNISVKMTSVSNKYTTIIDALDYADRQDKGRPNNISLITAKAGVYFDKLGGSSEKWYYRDRVRKETAYRDVANAPNRTGRRLELDSLVDAKFQIRPQYLQPGNIRLQDPKDPSMNYDGSELQHLQRWAPYPYGLSPYALAYAYYKRAQVLERVGNQVHPQLSDLVVDSRPALSLKFWSEDEWERGRRAEIEALALKMPPAAVERTEIELVSMRVPLSGAIVKPSAAERAIYSYDLSVRLCDDAEAEYQTHLRKHTQNTLTYQNHRDALQAQKHLLAGDRDYLRAMLLPADQRTALLASAKASYEQALIYNRILIVRYLISDPMFVRIAPAGVSKDNLLDHPQALEGLATQAAQAISAGGEAGGYAEDFEEYNRYVTRARNRLSSIANP